MYEDIVFISPFVNCFLHGSKEGRSPTFKRAPVLYFRGFMLTSFLKLQDCQRDQRPEEQPGHAKDGAQPHLLRVIIRLEFREGLVEVHWIPAFFRAISVFCHADS